MAETFEADSLTTEELAALDGVQSGTLIGWRGELFTLEVTRDPETNEIELKLHEVDQTEEELPPTSTIIDLDLAPRCIITPFAMWRESNDG